MMVEHSLSRPGLSLVIATLDEGEELHHTLRSVFSCVAAPDEVVVVDDGGQDGSCSALLQGEWTGLPIKVAAIERRGIAGARNHGRSLATMPKLAFLDAHCRLERDCFAALRAALDVRSDAIAAPALCNFGDEVFGCGADIVGPDLRTRWLTPPPSAGAPVPIVPGGCLAMDASVFDALGGFDDFRELGLEDVEFSLHAWRMGIDVVAVPSARVLHRFRAAPHYDLRATSRAYNLARLALVHFEGARQDRSLRSLIGMPRASEIIIEALASDWERRRDALLARCMRSAEDFFRRFGE